MAVPVLWPSTQAYYATLAVPGLTAAGAALMALPIPGAAVAAALVIAIQMRHWSLPRLREAWLPARNGTSTSS